MGLSLGVWSRDKVTGIGFEYSRVFLPSIHNGLVGRFPSQCFEMFGKVKGTHKGLHMCFQAFQVGIVKGLDRVASLLVRFMRSACLFVHG